MESLILIIVVVSTLAEFSKAQMNKTECIGQTENNVVTNVEVEYYPDLRLPDRNNLSSAVLTVTYEWEAAGEDFDGFLYCFYDGDTEWIKKGELSDKQIYIKHCESLTNLTLFVNNSRREYVQCNYPCQSELATQCAKANMCNVTTDCPTGDLTFAPKNQTTATFPIRFGRQYTFNVFAYRGARVLGSASTVNHDVYLFCGYHLIKNHSIDKQVAYEFCRDEQVISNLSSSSGPPRNFSIASYERNHTDHSVTVTIQWMPPHLVDNIHHKYPDSYRIWYIKNNEDPSVARKAKSKKRDAMHYYTYRKLRAGNQYIFFVSAYMLLDRICVSGHWCQNYGTATRLELYAEDWNPCRHDNVTGDRHCDPNATCEVISNDRSIVNCSCKPGFKGDGLSQVVGGRGCWDFNPCYETVTYCAPTADCVDLAPPSEGYDCVCPQGYIGNPRNTCISIKTLVLALVCPVMFVLVSAIVCYCCRKRSERVERRLIFKQSKFVPGETGSDIMPFLNYTQFENHLKTNVGPVFGKKWEIERDSLLLQDVLGRGNFGVVHKAFWQSDNGEKVVAVKSLTAMYAVSFREDFLAEMALLMTLGQHEAILGIIGVCTAQSAHSDGCESPLLVTEFMKYGDLLHYLWDCREPDKRNQNPIYNFSERDLYQIGQQIAGGLHFLSSSKIIHGDVAARNILVGENLRCKISDFGLANDVYRYGMIKGATERRVPFKWVSPERMMGGKVPITWRSDVWSFGILLYEMVTVGSTPYPTLEQSVLFETLESGFRMPKPSTCNEQLYQLMLRCWQWNPMNRPNFASLEEQLSGGEKGLWENGRTLNDEIMPVNESDRNCYDKNIGMRASAQDITIQNGNTDMQPISPFVETEFGSRLVEGDLLVSFEMDEV